MTRITMLIAAIVYIVIGLGTAALANATTGSARSAWRLGAWGLSFAIFLAQIAYGRLRRNEPARVTARDAAIAVALAAFVLALLGPVRSHWNAADFHRATLLSVVVWPILTGIPAYLVAWLIATTIIGLYRRAP